MLSGELVGRSALSGEIQKQVIAVGGGDAPIKSISVDGVEVEPDNNKNVNIDLSGKVDKTTEPLKVYGTDSQGNQVEWIFRNTNNTKNTVAGRDSNGNIQVGNAINGTDAVNKQYAEDNFVGKISDKAGLYLQNPDGTVAIKQMASGEAKPWTVAERSTDGTLYVGTPTENKHATNKQYVDDKFVEKQTPEFDAGATRGYAYTIEQQKNTETGEYEVVQTVKKLQIQANADTIPLRNPNGTFYVGNATLQYEAVNKGYVDDKFNGASKPITYDTYSEMITALNGMTATDIKRGQDIFIVQTGIPDVWVAYIEEANVPYTYVDDNTFVNELLTNGVVQVGYYKLGYLETQKVGLTEYVKNTDYATGTEAGVVKCKNASYGLYMADSGETIAVSQATNSEIDGKTSIFKPITCKNLDYAVKKALADSKLTGDDAWTDDEKKSARALIGATNLNTHANYGVQNNASGLVMVVKANDDEITNRSTAYKPIVPTNLDHAIVQGLTNNSITLDDTQKTAVQNWLGLGNINTALETILGV